MQSARRNGCPLGAHLVRTSTSAADQVLSRMQPGLQHETAACSRQALSASHMRRAAALSTANWSRSHTQQQSCNVADSSVCVTAQ